jgi:N-methylhydantoinase B/oxoprolinase/acetone carboxylase alpha subunit
MSKLDKEFVAVLNAKIAAAADAINEVMEMAEANGLQSLIYTQWTTEWLGKEKAKTLHDQLEDVNVSPLEDAISDAGWSISSSYC